MDDGGSVCEVLTQNSALDCGLVQSPYKGADIGLELGDLFGIRPADRSGRVPHALRGPDLLGSMPDEVTALRRDCGSDWQPYEARQALADPGSRPLTIAEVAHRWGRIVPSCPMAYLPFRLVIRRCANPWMRP